MRVDFKKKFGQGAIEFVTIFGFLLFFFVVFFTLIQTNVEKRNSEKESTILQGIALSVRDEINLAADSTDGYFREFNVPQNILGKAYNITLVGGSVYSSIGEGGYAYKIANVTGSIQKGVNFIRKENGTIYLNS